jgi:ParB family chromosome partitioning protein
MKRRALGKGLGSLIPEVPTSPGSTEGVRLLNPEAIVPNRFQPRENFAAAGLETLADSIRRDGLLQPIIVRPLNGGYEIVAGERRWRASIMAGLKRVPVLVQAVADDRALELALVENLQRQDLDPIEEARAYRILAERFAMTQEQVSEKVGKSRPAVANALRLLKLPQDLQDLLRGGVLSRGHARALLAVGDPREMRKLAERFQKEALSVRSAEDAVRPTKKGEARTSGAMPVDPNIRAAQEKLQGRLGTRVRIHSDRKGRGRIEISFGSPEELSRLFDGLMKARF